MSNDSYDAPAAEHDVEVHDDGPDAYEELKRLAESDRRAGGATPVWAPDDWHPDYAHLLIAEKKGVVAPHNFSLTPDVLDLLIEANSYQPNFYRTPTLNALLEEKIYSNNTPTDINIETFKVDYTDRKSVV